MKPSDAINFFGRERLQKHPYDWSIQLFLYGAPSTPAWTMTRNVGSSTIVTMKLCIHVLYWKKLVRKTSTFTKYYLARIAESNYTDIKQIHTFNYSIHCLLSSLCSCRSRFIKYPRVFHYEVTIWMKDNTTQ